MNGDGDNTPGGKSQCLAYTLYLTCGMFGTHHFYLGNDMMGIVYCLSFGGFGFGLLYDLFWLPSWVRAANLTPAAYAEQYKAAQKKDLKPALGGVKSFAMMALGYYAGMVAVYLVPPSPARGATSDQVYWDNAMRVVCRSMGNLVGMYTFATHNHERVVPFLKTFLVLLAGNYIADPGDFMVRDSVDYSTNTYVLVAASWYMHWASKWNDISAIRAAQRRGTCGRMFRVWLILCVGGAVAFVVIFNHMTLDMDDGAPPRTIREHVQTWMASDDYKQLRDGMWVIWLRVQNAGVKETWNGLWAELDMDPFGTRTSSALHVLGLPSDASWSVIKRKFRRLSLELHPDKNPSPEAAKKFAKVRDAYEQLQTIHKLQSATDTVDTGDGGGGGDGGYEGVDASSVNAMWTHNVVPDIFSPMASNFVHMGYVVKIGRSWKAKPITVGEVIPSASNVRRQPIVRWSSESDTLCTLIMLAAGTASDPTWRLLWLVTNIPEAQVNDGDVVLPYTPPSLPYDHADDAGKHRFVTMVHSQRRGEIEVLSTDVSLSHFRLEPFLSKYQLGDVYAAHLFLI